MGIADLFRPKYRHSDVRVRTEAVKALTADDAAILAQVARTDRDIGVRRIAMISGDRQAVATRVAAEIGCEEAQGECLPQYMWSKRLSARTPMPGVYLCGACTHPGGSVIGINGRNAAAAVLRDLGETSKLA